MWFFLSCHVNSKVMETYCSILLKITISYYIGEIFQKQKNIYWQHWGNELHVNLRSAEVFWGNLTLAGTWANPTLYFHAYYLWHCFFMVELRMCLNCCEWPMNKRIDFHFPSRCSYPSSIRYIHTNTYNPRLITCAWAPLPRNHHSICG